MKLLDDLSNWVARVSEVLSGLIIAVLSVVLMAQVILRTFFKSGIPWSVEFSIISIIWSVMLIGNVLIKHDEMITVDFFDTYLPKTLIRYRDIIYQIIFIAMMSLMFYFGTVQALNGFNMKTASLRIDWFYPYLSIPVGIGLMLFQYIVKIIQNIKGEDVK